MRNDEMFFLLIRFAIATSMAGHGLAKLPKLREFSHTMIMSFEKSILPQKAVKIFSFILPFIEFTVGLFLFLGLFTGIAAAAGGILMISLMVGSAVTEKWDAMISQLIHVAFFAALLHFIQHNAWSVDALLNG